ncbi:MAG: metallophosphoesterase family protein [Chitinophagaceae bacterium]|nr:metallophosphoesterase family protein [Chitinophagaceae bacterium]
MTTGIRRIVLLSIISVCSNLLVAQVIKRGPYLNAVTGQSAIVRWKTGGAIKAKVTWWREGEVTSSSTVEKRKAKTHEVKIEGLQPGTKYFYRTEERHIFPIVDSTQFFRTAPVIGSQSSVRIWASGDFGDGSINQRDCYQAMLSVSKDHLPDAWIWLGDNAYESGTEEEYQRNVFEVYDRKFFQQTPIYPTPGNHDYRDKRENGAKRIAYYDLFSVPAFYSFDYGNVHLISLNSEEETKNGFTIADSTSKQIKWLKKDLETNRQKWTIAYLHRPPYTSAGSHNSDKEMDLVRLRQNIVPILEKYGVDVLIAGHSHVYERIRGNAGVVYLVAGSGGHIDNDGIGSPHPATIYSNSEIGGSLLIDAVANCLTFRWVCADGKVRDEFSLHKY